MAITPTPPDQASLMSLCFLKEITDDGVIVDPTEMIEEVVPRDEYRDEMDMMAVSQITSIVQLQPVSPFDMFGLSTIEYSLVSCDNISIFVPHSPTSQIFDIDDEIAQPDLDRDSFDHDSDPIDERFSRAIGDVEIVDFGIEDQPKEPKIGSPLSTNENDRLIHLLRSYLDVFAWSYEDMPDLDPFIVQRHLPILPHARLIKKKLRRLHPPWSLVMPFGLKNARATYHRVTTTLYQDMMHRDVEVYVDDMIVKS
ncbi:hypothetical protein CK203_044127 [Vitis vinifera]|uniref:Reverse transcriptase domain-containing protein n=1 Tax=Vitis vinifera TaxID=29760 RepID=A0A438I2L0_VITVI|nr:hypothetical protein CK203_044127 [Vitis vinifera]